jgi:hypothetical protein
MKRMDSPSAHEDQTVPGLMAVTRTKKRYPLCVRNKGCEDLESRKLYEQLSDPRAAEVGYVRVVDQSGEDHLYPSDYFVAVDLPREAERALAGAALRG